MLKKLFINKTKIMNKEMSELEKFCAQYFIIEDNENIDSVLLQKKEELNNLMKKEGGDVILNTYKATIIKPVVLKAPSTFSIYVQENPHK